LLDDQRCPHRTGRLIAREISVNRKLPAEETNSGKSLGLGLAGASDANIERALEVARDAIDAQAMRELRASLDQMMEQPDVRALKRENVLALLKTISEGVRPATDRPIGPVATGEMLVSTHPAIELLDELIDALSDLDRGKTDPSLRACSDGPNASLTTRERKWDDALLEAVSNVQHARGLKTRTAAENVLASILDKAGKMRRGKVYSPRMLKRLHHDRIKRK
jgi:hypothetical protein